MSKHALLALLLAVLSSVPALAEPAPPYLVKDLNQTVPENVGSSPFPLGIAGGRAIFVTFDNRLWASDGTAGGTRLLRDVPSRLLRARDGAVRPRVLKATGGRLFLLDSTEGIRHLLVTDGTRAGTYLLAGGARLQDPQRFPQSYLWSDALRLFFFSALDSAHGMEPWVTDGTPAGTRLLRDVLSGTGSSDAGSFVSIGSQVFFQAFASTAGPHFWRTDGTEGGTVPVPGSERLYGFEFLSLGSKVVFITYGASTLELWSTNGIRGAARLARIPGAEEDWDLYFLGAATGRLYFYSAEGKAGFRLWISDGTAKGTRPLARFPRTADLYGSPKSLRFLLDGTALFFVDDGIHGTEWWRSNGTVAGTRLVKDVCPGSCASYLFLLAGLPVQIGNRLFVHLRGSKGEEPWVSDGTAAGTRMIADTCPGACSSSSSARIVAGGLEIYSAKPENGDPKEVDLWRTDGTPAGTFRLAQSQSANGGYLPAIVLGHQILFDKDDGVHGLELWATDGTVAGTHFVADLEGTEQAGSTPDHVTAVGHRIFFLAEDGVHGQALWVSDGTPGGTSLVHAPAVPPAPYPPQFWNLSAAGLRLIFILQESSAPPRLWASDGTAQGTQPIAEIIPQSDYMPLGNRLLFSAPGGLWVTDGTSGGTSLVTNRVSVDLYSSSATLGATLLFAAHGPEGAGLWKTDGTDAGTVLVQGQLSIDTVPWTTSGGKIYFSASGPGGNSLYESDGTAAGTRRLEAPVFGFALTTAAGRFFFVESHGSASSLSVTDGTAAGTHKVADVVPGSADGLSLTAAGSQVFFIARDEAHGAELWRSDGTAAGTFMVRDISPGSSGSAPYGLTVANGVVYFNAYDGLHGTELWRSDGTPGGTFQVAELAPGPLSSNSQQLVQAGPRLFFSADDGSHGPEPWALCLASPCSSSVP